MNSVNGALALLIVCCGCAWGERQRLVLQGEMSPVVDEQHARWTPGVMVGGSALYLLPAHKGMALVLVTVCF